jgi:membrane protein implicated in regulation of membrane protease activity
MRIIRFTLQLVLLVLALAVVFPHLQNIWYGYPDKSFWGAIAMELAYAWIPLLIALAIVALAIWLEWFLGRRDDKEKKRAINTLNNIEGKLDELIKVLKEVRPKNETKSGDNKTT